MQAFLGLRTHEEPDKSSSKAVNESVRISSVKTARAVFNARLFNSRKNVVIKQHSLTSHLNLQVSAARLSVPYIWEHVSKPGTRNRDHTLALQSIARSAAECFSELDLGRKRAVLRTGLRRDHESETVRTDCCILDGYSRVYGAASHSWYRPLRYTWHHFTDATTICNAIHLQIPHTNRSLPSIEFPNSVSSSFYISN